jgi:hypothetical protein
MLRLRLAVVVGIAVVATAACSSGKSSNDQSSTPSLTSAAQTSTSAAVTSTSSAAPPSSSASASTLSGTWHGQYTGSFTGTFVLSWQQAGSTLSGTIALSTAGGTVPIHGTVSGNTINFGTVGSSAITYTGSVSGKSMSGNYQVAGAAGGSGTWSASKA